MPIRLRIALETNGQRIEKDWVLAATDAPPDYDWGGTVSFAETTLPWPDEQGHFLPARLIWVRPDEQYVRMQAERYRSGLYRFWTPDRVTRHLEASVHRLFDLLVGQLHCRKEVQS